MRFLASAVAALLLFGCASTGERVAVVHHPSGLHVSVPKLPTPFRNSDGSHLVYELLVRNQSPNAVTLERVEIASGGELVHSLDATTLKQSARVLRRSLPKGAAKAAAGVVPAGATAAIYLWLHAPKSEQLPRRLKHDLRVGGYELTVPSFAVDGREPRIISKPVAGHNWVAANAPSNKSMHRRSLQKLDSGWYTAQRYAIDLVRALGEAGSFAGDPAKNGSFYAYGAELLAVANGTVVAVKDGIPDNVPRKKPYAVEITYDTLAGNYVVLDIGDGVYVTYAHVKAGSLRVTTGQRVGRGDVVALIGNSGNSTEPHLHFHVCDAPSVLACHGVPYAFDHLVEQTLDLRNRNAPPVVGKPTPLSRALPRELSVVHFDPPPESP